MTTEPIAYQEALDNPMTEAAGGFPAGVPDLRSLPLVPSSSCCGDASAQSGSSCCGMSSEASNPSSACCGATPSSSSCCVGVEGEAETATCCA
jgi:hypothetical protein